MTRVHIVGAGLAGLSAAVALTQEGRQVTLYEAGPAAGGRCRSYFDRELGCRIDNGNHLLLSGNSAAMTYLETIGARSSMAGPGDAWFPFFDLASGERWVVALGRSRVPWWILLRRVPRTRLREYLSLLVLRRAGVDATVAAMLAGGGQLYHRLLEPLAIAALNTKPEEALARLLATVIDQTLMRGGGACIPLYPRLGLSESFVDPALLWLRGRGGELRTSHRVGALRLDDARVVALEGPDGSIPLAPGDAVVLAVPPWVAASLLPGIIVPEAFEAILNIHFRITADPGRAGFIGIIGGTAEWIFVKHDVVSVTISAANRLVDLPATDIAARVWPDVRAALALPEPMPLVRVVKEKRATFAATASQERRRPGARTRFTNLALAGDWTATGLPATIEGAIRSGRVAVEALRG
jgi:squalene-associated FAD-dependent desaturase